MCQELRWKSQRGLPDLEEGDGRWKFRSTKKRRESMKHRREQEELTRKECAWTMIFSVASQRPWGLGERGWPIDTGAQWGQDAAGLGLSAEW